MSYESLEKACGGAINPDTLEEFEQAMREYNEFMQRARVFFGPRSYGAGYDEEETTLR